jgi:hypothetical protein
MKIWMETRPKALFASLVLGFAADSFASAADIRVPADYPTIQTAVDAAEDDDTIHIASGVYFEQVRINSKKLILIGQPGTILRATETLPEVPGNPAPQWPVMFVLSSEVTVRGLTFEGERLAGSFVGIGELKGIFLRESSANVENCAFYGFRERVPGEEDATAITATGFDDGQSNAIEFAEVYDMHGSRLWSGVVSDLSLDLSPYVPGIYMLRMLDRAGNDSLTRIVKQ